MRADAAPALALALGKALLLPPYFGVWLGWGPTGGSGCQPRRGWVWKSSLWGSKAPRAWKRQFGVVTWEDAALSDGGESGFFCFHIPNKGLCGDGGCSHARVISWAPLTHSEPHQLQYSMSSSRRAVLGYLFTSHGAGGCVWGRSKSWTGRGGVSPRSEAVVVGFCLPLLCPQVSSHRIKACSRQWVLGGVSGVWSPCLPGGHGHSLQHGDLCSLWHETGVSCWDYLGLSLVICSLCPLPAAAVSPWLGVFV